MESSSLMFDSLPPASDPSLSRGSAIRTPSLNQVIEREMEIFGGREII